MLKQTKQAVIGAMAMATALAMSTAPAYAQACLHGADESPEQAARRKEALTAARSINNIQANQPGAASRVYFRDVELATAPYAAEMQKSTNPTTRRISLNPAEDIVPGWKLTLDVSKDSYWFMVKDKTDPCGFAFISNRDGLIYTAQHLR